MKWKAKPKVIRIIKVRSFSHKDKFYLVKFWNDGGISCECPAFIYHSNIPCKHIRKVQEFLNREK